MTKAKDNKDEHKNGSFDESVVNVSKKPKRIKPEDVPLGQTIYVGKRVIVGTKEK